MIPREESKAGPILGIIGGTILVFSIPISLILGSEILTVPTDDFLENIFRLQDIFSILIVVGIFMNIALGTLCIILSSYIYIRGADPSVRPICILLIVFGAIGILISIIMIGGLIGLIGGLLCIVGGCLATIEIQAEAVSIVQNSLVDQFVCERCGEDISKEARFCPHCGVRYEE